ncbi:MAG TPA: esterase, partial [Chryseolinea sp.]|nr:esterase [Chryseolinea sp.]
MQQKQLINWVMILLFNGICFAQNAQTVVEDFKPSSTNQPGRDYPMVNSEGRVR